MAIQLCEGDKGLNDLRITFHNEVPAIEHMDEKVQRDRRCAFARTHINGWLVFQTLKNFVPADFFGKGANKQRVKEGRRAIRVLGCTIWQLADANLSPATAKMLRGCQRISSDEWMMIIHPLLDGKFKALKGMENTNVGDYYKALEAFEALVFGGFKSNERPEFWDNFLKQILYGDVNEVHDVQFEYYQSVTARKESEKKKLDEEKKIVVKSVSSEKEIKQETGSTGETVKHEAKPVSYAGYKFRSTLEAKWAVFFDACGVGWKYEPKKHRVDGYQIDFVVDEVAFYHGLYSADQVDVSNFFFEVKGQPERAKTLEKTKQFIGRQLGRDDYYFRSKPTLVLNKIPFGGTLNLLMDDAKRMREQWINDAKPYWPEGDVFPYSTTTFTLDDTCAIPCISTDGELMIAYYGHEDHVDVNRTIAAYGIAWNTDFGEDGLTPEKVRQIMHNKTVEVKPKIIVKNRPVNFGAEEYSLAMEKFGEMVPSTRKMLSKVIFGGFDGSTVTLLFDGTGRLIKPLLERNMAKMEEAFTQSFGVPVKVRMLDMDRGIAPTLGQTAKRVIAQSYDVLGRDKVELSE